MSRRKTRSCARCGCVLSRYNSEDQCAACRRSDHTPVIELPTVPPQVWNDPTVRSALDDWDFGQLSRIVRKSVPLRQEDVAALTGLSQSYLSMLECGDRRLTDVGRVVQFLSGLGVPSELVHMPLPGAPRPSQVPPIGSHRETHGEGAEEGQTEPSVGESETQPQEHGVSLNGPMLDPTQPWTSDRLLLGMSAALHVDASATARLSGVANKLGTPAQSDGIDAEQGVFAVREETLDVYIRHWGTEQAQSLRRAAGGARVTSALCDYLQGTTDELRLMDAGTGSGSVAGMARAHYALVVQALEHGNFDEAIGRRLAGVAADAATQAGWYAFDADRHTASQAYLLAALRAAHAAEDARLSAGALSYMAIHAYGNNSPHKAVAAAIAGREQVKNLDVPHLEAVLLTRQARGHALRGERSQADRALGAAGELCARGPGKDDPHWIYWMNEGEIYGQSGSANLAMGSTGVAVQCFERAADTLNPAEQRTRGLVLSRAAQAYARAGELDAACAVGQEVVTLAEHVQSARLRQHMLGISDDLRPAAGPGKQGHSSVQHLMERIHEVSS